MLTTNEPITPQQTLAESLVGKILTLAVNLLVLTELCIAMFFATHQPDRLVEIFFTVFFSQLAPTLVAFVIVKRLIIRRGQSCETVKQP